MKLQNEYLVLIQSRMNFNFIHSQQLELGWYFNFYQLEYVLKKAHASNAKLVMDGLQ